MENLLGNSLETIFVLKDTKSKRISSYDKTGGNMDWIDIEPGENKTIADINESGIIRHMWMTLSSEENYHLRKINIRAYWDDEEHPSIEAPLGDFFGIGFGIFKNFNSLPLQMAPENGKAMNCYFPMPFRKSAKIKIENNCDDFIRLYYYVDYEATKVDDNVGYFHAKWNRVKDTDGWYKKDEKIWADTLGDEDERYPWYPRAWKTENKDGKDNYVILDAIGKGHYVGCNLNIDNFNDHAENWYGEGDDMIFIDGESWPPTLHGTGTEDYFNTAFCPKTEFSNPQYGITVYSGDKIGRDFGGKNSLYRFHISDPIRFEKEIKVTIEIGHNNKFSNDYSSTAYWYQTEPHNHIQIDLSTKNTLPR